MLKLSAFEQGLQYALADDGRIGPNDAPALRKLAKAEGRPDVAKAIAALVEAYEPPKVRATRKDSGYGARVVSYEPAGKNVFNSDQPELALGRPEGAGAKQGSLHVVGLGKRGRITLELGRAATRGLVVFENAFLHGGKVANPEPAKVEVSADGQRWYELEGKAGLSPVFANSANHISPRSPRAGGDRFSFADAGVPAGTAIRLVRITDLGKGFDLDAVYGY